MRWGNLSWLRNYVVVWWLIWIISEVIGSQKRDHTSNDTKDRLQPRESLLFKKQHQTVGRNGNQLRQNVPSETLQDRQNAGSEECYQTSPIWHCCLLRRRMEWLLLQSQLSGSLKCQWTTSKLLAILHLERLTAIQHHRNSVNNFYPALQIRAAVNPRPMKYHHPKGRRRKVMARKNGPRQLKNWHDPQPTSGTTTWYRWVSWPACPHRR